MSCRFEPCSGAWTASRRIVRLHRGSDPMLDHISLRVADYERSKKFYAAALAPLGFTLAMESASSGAGFRRDRIPGFWIKQGEPGRLGDDAPTEPGSCGGPAIHVAFA